MVKCTLVQALRLCTGRTAQRGSRGIALLFLDHGTRKGCGVSVTPRPLFIPRGKTRYPLYRRLGGPQDRSGQVRKISPTQGFDPRPAQPVASRYTIWAIATHDVILSVLLYVENGSAAGRTKLHLYIITLYRLVVVTDVQRCAALQFIFRRLWCLHLQTRPVQEPWRRRH